jgi:hypothetical protein
MKVRCSSCGRIDRARVLIAFVDLLLGTTAMIGAIGIVFLVATA